MDTINGLITALKALIRIGIICRVIFCLVRIITNNDDNGVTENKQKIKHALIFLVLSECVWIIRDLVFEYYGVSGTA